MNQEFPTKLGFEVVKYGFLSDTYILLYNDGAYMPTYITMKMNIPFEDYSQIFLSNNAKISSSSNFYFEDIKDAQAVADQLNILIKLSE